MTRSLLSAWTTSPFATEQLPSAFLIAMSNHQNSYCYFFSLSSFFFGRSPKLIHGTYSIPRLTITWLVCNDMECSLFTWHSGSYFMSIQSLHWLFFDHALSLSLLCPAKGCVPSDNKIASTPLRRMTGGKTTGEKIRQDRGDFLPFMSHFFQPSLCDLEARRRERYITVSHVPKQKIDRTTDRETRQRVILPPPHLISREWNMNVRKSASLSLSLFPLLSHHHNYSSDKDLSTSKSNPLSATTFTSVK